MLYLTIIPWAPVGYEMIDSQRGELHYPMIQFLINAVIAALNKAIKQNQKWFVVLMDC